MKVELRALEPEDIDVLYKWENDRRVWKISNTIAPFSRYVLTKYIESAHLDIYQTKQLRLMIDVIGEHSNKTVGAIDLFDFDPHHMRVGIGVLIGETEDRGNGYADSALSILVQYIFEHLGCKQVYCNILCSNTSSIKLFEKHGFQLVGIKRKWVRIGSEFEDEAMYQLIQNA